MEQEKWSEIQEILSDIQNSNKKLISELSELKINSRDLTIKQIHKDILKKDKILKKFFSKNGELCAETTDQEPKLTKSLIETIILSIKENPAKKVFYLKKFLDKMEDISESDKKVILQSLENTELEKMKSKMNSLVQIFNVNASE